MFKSKHPAARQQLSQLVTESYANGGGENASEEHNV
jgi:hypothetical protein